jgi:histidinol-phosphate phosphatase family protein
MAHRQFFRPAAFLDRDGVINREVNLLHHPSQLELLPGAANAIRRLNEAGWLAIVITNQPVVARGLCDESQLRVIHDKLETLLGREGAYLDAIYYCPHHPDRGYPGENPVYKVACGCRKPATGLLEAAQREFRIDLARSVFVGDTARDIQTGHNAGIRTVLVRTGYGPEQSCSESSPTYRCADLGAAVEWILLDGSGSQAPFPPKATS